MKSHRLFIVLFSMYSLLSFTSAAQWVQTGADIDGESPGDLFGYSVCMNKNGDRFVAGAPYNKGNGVESGHARVFRLNGSAWMQLGNDIDGEGVGDRSGWAVSINGTGDRVAIGAPLNSDSAIKKGHVRVYGWDGTNWNQIGKDLNGEAQGDWFGYSVSLNNIGDRLAVGAPLNDSKSTNAGHVKIFSWNGTSWALMGSSIQGEGQDDWSGYAVSFNDSGNRVAIGAPNNSDKGSNSGQVRVYEWNGTSWIKVGQDIDGSDVNDQLGHSVSMNASGTILSIGAPANSTNSLFSGKVQSFNWTGGNWVLMGNPIYGEKGDDRSGKSVSINDQGNILAIGAHWNDGSGSNSGHVRIWYSFPSNPGGGPITGWAKLLNSDIDGENANDWSGSSVSLNGTGLKLAVGAPRNDDNGSNAGHVRVFTRTGLSVRQIPHNDDLVNIFPNPSRGRVYLDSHREIRDVKIFNNVGKELLTFDQVETHIDLSSDLPSGIYFIRMTLIDNATITKEIILQK